MNASNLKKALSLLLITIISLLLGVVILNAVVILTSKPHIVSESEALSEAPEQPYDAIIVLGAGIRNGRPTPLLAERLDTGISLFKAGFSETLILSGDSEKPYEYDEVGVMTDYAVEKGVPRDAIIKDNLGLNTHSTVYRAKNLYGVHRYILVSQNYHLERGVFLARAFGADVLGVSADRQAIVGQLYRDLREIPARVKDFFVARFQLAPELPPEP